MRSEEIAIVISVVALIVAIISVIYTRISALESIRANEVAQRAVRITNQAVLDYDERYFLTITEMMIAVNARVINTGPGVARRIRLQVTGDGQPEDDSLWDPHVPVLEPAARASLKYDFNAEGLTREHDETWVAVDTTITVHWDDATAIGNRLVQGVEIFWDPNKEGRGGFGFRQRHPPKLILGEPVK